MRFLNRRLSGFVGLTLVSLALTGCLGWGAIFAEQRALSGDYSLIQGEGNGSVYLMVKGRSGSVAGPLHEIGWSQRYIVFTDDNWPTRWSVMDVAAHQMFKLPDSQRMIDDRFKGIKIISPQDAWTAAKRNSFCTIW
jgi:hypothetical protein